MRSGRSVGEPDGSRIGQPDGCQATAQVPEAARVPEAERASPTSTDQSWTAWCALAPPGSCNDGGGAEGRPRLGGRPGSGAVPGASARSRYRHG